MPATKTAPAKKVVARRTTAAPLKRAAPVKERVVIPPPEPEPEAPPLRKPPKIATTTEIEKFAADLSDAFLLCRDVGHTWRPWGARWAPEDNVFYRSWRCLSCRSKRHQILSNRGAVLKSNYDHTDGYLHKGLGRIQGDARDTLRLESTVRLTVASEQKSRK